MLNKFDKTFGKRALSWSQLSSFSKELSPYASPERWYDTYILGNRQTSKEMTFGSTIDLRFQEDSTFLPDVPRGEVLQHELAGIYNGIRLIGKPDILSFRDSKFLADLKTGRAPWTKKKADTTGQLTFYAFLLWINYKVNPEEFDMAIYWLPTRESEKFEVEIDPDAKVKVFKTKRTMRDVLKFVKVMERIIGEMEEYVKQRE